MNKCYEVGFYNTLLKLVDLDFQLNMKVKDLQKPILQISVIKIDVEFKLKISVNRRPIA